MCCLTATEGPPSSPGTFPATKTGSYFVNVIPGPKSAPLSVGVTIPYSEEFRIRETNQALISELASVKPAGGETGEVTAPLGASPDENPESRNAFRGGLSLARSIRDAWPWFVLAGCCVFLGDIFVRRVAINFDWIGVAIKKIRGMPDAKDATTTARLDALKKNKELLDEELQRRRTSVRFEPTQLPDENNAGDWNADVKDSKQTINETKKLAPDPDEPSYTERLLAAKRKARKD